MLSSTNIRKIKDSLSWLKRPVVRLSGGSRRVRRQVALGLRRRPGARHLLNLPQPICPSFEPWLEAAAPPSRWIPVLPAGEVAHDIPTSNEEKNRWFFEQHALTPQDPVGVAVIARGSVHGHNGGQYLTEDGAYLWNLGRENWRYFGSFYIDSRLHLPRPAVLNGRAAVLAHEHAYDNFAHWTFDVLPKIGLLKTAGIFDDIDWFLVGHAHRPYQMHTLESLGVPMDKVLPFGPHAFFTADEIVVPRLYGYRSMHHRGWALDYLASACAQPIDSRRRRLFISREDAAFRKLRGEGELCARLQRLGFERATLSGLGLGETIELFQQAEVVVGPSGSGIMNIAFCRPGTAVVEIVPPRFYNCYHWYLSGERRLRHAVYFGDDRVIPVNRAPNKLTADITIDVDDCARFIERFLEAPAGPQ